MSVLGLKQVVEKIKKAKLLENVGERDLKNPEGVGIDLRLGSVHKITGGGAFIEVDGKNGLGKRKGVKTDLVAEYNPRARKATEVLVEPNEYYLVTTFEKVNTPKDLMPLVYPRSSLFRAGLLLLNTKTDPGYKGALTMGLINLSKFPVKFQMGARIANMVFMQIEGDTVEYRGQHQGGRVSFGEEQQV